VRIKHPLIETLFCFSGCVYNVIIRRSFLSRPLLRVHAVRPSVPSAPGMCNPKNYSDSPATSKSTVEELHRPIPSLFRALTEGDAPINMMVVSFPVAEELSHHENLVSFLETLDDQHQNVSLPGNSIHASYDTQGTSRLNKQTNKHICKKDGIA